MLAEIEPPSQSLPLASLVQGEWWLTLGDFSQAEARFSEARDHAEAQQEPLLAAESLLGLAQTRLARGELEAAANTFLAAGRQFQLVESVSGDGQAMLGVAQTLIGQQAWEQAREHCEGALTRFRQSDDQPGQADAQLSLGLARRGSGQTQEAAGQFERALTLYRQQQQPSGEADTRFELAGIYLEQGNLEQAQSALTGAIALTERVMNTLSTPEQRRTFLGQFAELYTLTAITQVRRDQDTQARQTLASYTRMAGSAAVVSYIKAYETEISVADEDTSEAEKVANKNLVKRLKQLRSTL